ncbi:hypothetical protein NE237_010621 [Protea cynaroides]|uniref:Uncharacterized protein n=1 Tax=Protea cynaroides TaxID=273540 RepID=A0A9Q0L038_9MAGN|nr:hypothetical protein NE237_010621 [Protea cynaroides]
MGETSSSSFSGDTSSDSDSSSGSSSSTSTGGVFKQVDVEDLSDPTEVIQDVASTVAYEAESSRDKGAVDVIQDAREDANQTPTYAALDYEFTLSLSEFDGLRESDESRVFEVLASCTGTPVHTKELLDPYFLYTYRILQMSKESLLALRAKMATASRGTKKATKISLVVASKHGAVTALPATQVSEVTKEKSRKRGRGDPSDKVLADAAQPYSKALLPDKRKLKFSTRGPLTDRSGPSSQTDLIPQGREDPSAIGTNDCADKVRNIGVMEPVPMKKRGDETVFCPSSAVVTIDTAIGDP